MITVIVVMLAILGIVIVIVIMMLAVIMAMMIMGSLSQAMDDRRHLRYDSFLGTLPAVATSTVFLCPIT